MRHTKKKFDWENMNCKTLLPQKNSLFLVGKTYLKLTYKNTNKSEMYSKLTVTIIRLQ